MGSQLFCKSSLIIPDKKGAKIAQHLREDYNLDPSIAKNRDFLRNRITYIQTNYTEVRQNLWRGIGPGGTEAQALFYRQGNDVVVTELNGTFVAIFKDGVSNSRFLGGKVLDRR